MEKPSAKHSGIKGPNINQPPKVKASTRHARVAEGLEEALGVLDEKLSKKRR